MTFKVGDLVTLIKYKPDGGIDTLIGRLTEWFSEYKCWNIVIVDSPNPADYKGYFQRYPWDIKLSAIAVAETLPDDIPNR